MDHAGREAKETPDRREKPARFDGDDEITLVALAEAPRAGLRQ